MRGSRPGERRGGRKKGTPNRATAARAAAVAASGLTPLDYLLSVMRDEAVELHVRIEAARAAANYVHPRLNAVSVGTREGDPIAAFFAGLAGTTLRPAED